MPCVQNTELGARGEGGGRGRTRGRSFLHQKELLVELEIENAPQQPTEECFREEE